jgi:hypothetical protein
LTVDDDNVFFTKMNKLLRELIDGSKTATGEMRLGCLTKFVRDVVLQLGKKEEGKADIGANVIERAPNLLEYFGNVFGIEFNKKKKACVELGGKETGVNEESVNDQDESFSGGLSAVSVKKIVATVPKKRGRPKKNQAAGEPATKITRSNARKT